MNIESSECPFHYPGKIPPVGVSLEGHEKVDLAMQGKIYFPKYHCQQSKAHCVIKFFGFVVTGVGVIIPKS